jgi:hypothetical protein
LVRISGFFVGTEANCLLCIDGLRPAEHTLITEDITRNDFENKTTFSLTYSAKAGYNFNVSVSLGQDGIYTRTISGTCKDIADKTAYSKFVALRTAQGWDTLSAPFVGGICTTDSHEENDINTTCNFNIVHRSVHAALPDNITNADVSIETTTDGNGCVKKRVNGWFEGTESACTAAIATLVIAGDICISESITRAKYSNRTSFSMEYLSANSEILYSTESLSVESQITDFVFKRVLGGGNPIKQTTSKTTARARQSGTIKKLSGYPLEPGLNWPSDNLKRKEVTRISPEYLTGSGYVYGLNYSYDFEFSSDPGWT